MVIDFELESAPGGICSCTWPSALWTVPPDDPMEAPEPEVVTEPPPHAAATRPNDATAIHANRPRARGAALMARSFTTSGAAAPRHLDGVLGEVASDLIEAEAAQDGGSRLSLEKEDERRADQIDWIALGPSEPVGQTGGDRHRVCGLCSAGAHLDREAPVLVRVDVDLRTFRHRRPSFEAL